MSLIELRDVRLRDPLLVRISIKNLRTILRAFIRTLLIHFRRVMRHREEYAQNLAVRDDCRIKTDLDRFGVTGPAGTDRFVIGSRLLATGIAGQYLPDALHVLKYSLSPPETSAG